MKHAAFEIATISARAATTEDLTGRSRLARNVIFAWGGYAVNVLAGFIMPRMISDRLGQSMLGVWDFSWGIVSYFGLVQLGLGSSVDRYVAHYRAKGDREGLCRSVSTIGFSLRISGVLAGVLTIVTAYWILPLLTTSLDKQLSAARWVVLFLGAEISALLMLTIYGAVIVGCHRWDIHNTISALTYTAMTIGMVAALMMGQGLPALALVHCLAFVGGEIARVKIVSRVCPELKVSYRTVSRETWLEQMRFSAKSIIPRVADLLGNQMLALLVGAFLGPSMLAIYSRPRNLLRQIQTLAAKFGFILIPTASSLHAQKDKATLRATFWSATSLISSFAMPVVATLALLGDALIQVWMGPTYRFNGLITILAVGSFPAIVQEPIWSILAGMNQHGRLALYKLIGGLCSAALLWLGLAVFHCGLLGAALAFAVPQLIVDGFVIPTTACRRFEVSILEYYFKTFWKPFLCVLPYFGCLLLARFTLSNSPWMAFACSVGGIVTLSYIYWIAVIPAEAKQTIKRRSRAVLLFGDEEALPDVDESNETAAALCVNRTDRIPNRSGARIFIVFRNDDPSAVFDLDHEREIFGLFEKYGVVQTLGVIPNVSLANLHDSSECNGSRPLFENKAASSFLRDYVDRTGSEVALHGYTHQTNRRSIPRRREYFEFRKLPLGEQETMLRAGTRILEQVFGTRPVTFIPPWNRWDTNTLAACRRVGCRIISAGPYVPPENGLAYFGANTDLSLFETAYSEAKRAEGRIFLNVLFHSRTIRSEDEKQRLGKVLAAISSDPECRTLTISQAIDEAWDELMLVNQAGKSIVPLHEIKNSVCSRAWVYLELLRRLGCETEAAVLQRVGRQWYASANYAECHRLAESLDVICRKILFKMRTAALVVGGCVGATATALHGMSWLKVLPLHGFIPLSALGLGILLARQATADDSRKELVVSALLFAIGALSTSLILMRI